MVKILKQIAIKAFEEKMLKIYATIMTTIFLAIWIPAMVAVVKEILKHILNESKDYISSQADQVNSDN